MSKAPAKSSKKNATTASTTTVAKNTSFQQGDDIIVTQGKGWHPAKFMEYTTKKDNSILAKVHFVASSKVAEVEVHCLELMGKVGKEVKSTRTTRSSTRDRVLASPPTPNTLHEAPPPPNLQVSPPPSSSPKEPKPENPHHTYNNGSYRISNVGKNFTSYICNSFKIQNAGDDPSASGTYRHFNDVQNIMRKKGFNKDDWVFIRCPGKFNAYPNGKVEIERPHDCSSTFEVDLEDMIDERPFIIVLSPFPGFGLSSEQTRSELRKMILATPDLWTPVFGGNDMRFHTPDLKEKHPDMYETVKHHMSWYVSRVQKQYPSLNHVKYSLLMSNPQAGSQEFHFDYEDRVTNKDPERQPVSLIAALDPFRLDVVVDYVNNRYRTWPYSISQGDAIVFTNKAEHRGGVNEHHIQGKPAHAVRLFAYMVSDERDFPPDTVQQYAIDEDEEGIDEDEAKIEEDEDKQIDEDEDSSIPPPVVAAMTSGGKKRKPSSQKSMKAAVAVAGEGGKRRKKREKHAKKSVMAASSTLQKSVMTARIPRKAAAKCMQCDWSLLPERKPCNQMLPEPCKCSVTGCHSLVHEKCVMLWERGVNYKMGLNNKCTGLIVCREHHDYFQEIGGGGKVGPGQI
jgi:hypothetical protein